MTPFRTLAASLSALILAAGSAAAQAPHGRDQTADQQVLHALNRLAFGPRPGEVARVRAMGVDRWIAAQLEPAGIADTAAERMLRAYPGLGMEQAEISRLYREQVRARRMTRQQDAPARPAADATMAADPSMAVQARRNARRRDADDPGRRLNDAIGDVAAAKVARAVTSERQLQEVMADFWANHFSVARNKGQTRLFLAHYDREVIRPHAMGKFRDLLGAVAKSPAMLFYLDNARSVADQSQRPARISQPPRGINENYARELLELHTLGVDGGYTQRDVIEVARALTGWTMNPRQGTGFLFRPEIHDADAKVVLGHRLAAGRGIEDGEEVLDIVARHPATARFIARKLVIRFVSDEPPQALVERAAATFRRTDGDIRETVRTIVTSPEFFSRAAYRAKVKSPFELVASALRAVGAKPDTTPRSAQLVAFLGAPIFGHQAPNGWPETGDSWMNAGAILNRINFGLALAGGRVPGASIAQWPEEARLRSAPREQQVDAVVSAFLGGQASPDTREILIKGENPLAAKLAAQGAGAAETPMSPGNDDDQMAPVMETARARQGMRAAPLGRPVQLEGLAQVVGLAIGAPEFQRR